ncbi:class I SAM-dependent methyltransferase [Conexibacter sp. JD483]|uniref:class I SAM-dependent methyltransferase n=1 Tax=unclassified Conexibacter TaxID=2627773 RepID=UPI00271E6B70|nr:MULTISPECIES: class I SAM-dependent methyltransferase [unclassified Conexibacter]MDO8186394.1 class I SAM-dependent methyltransferase [Conexibacter sp. CPCC 205706]MDO8199793.1 class I SAM-dependent methyltransferase [Conexibacter sp. CPCC 205762]MDR9369187.1 class I SAM-dependent methyltransferase [Conexibacter sp. JD483]
MRTLTRQPERRAGYVRAAGRAPLALYDPLVALTVRERTFRSRLLAQVLDGAPPERPLDLVEVGCGTGSFTTMLGGAGVRAIGIDGDPATLARARGKRGAEAVDWREGLADALPLPDASADRVVMSLLLHHLSPATQRTALAEARRVLRPGGRIHVADWGPARDPLMRLAFRGLQLLDGVENTAPLGNGELPGLLAAAGFGDQRLHDRLRTLGGPLELRSARAAG